MDQSKRACPLDDDYHVLHRTNAFVDEALRQVEAEVERVTGYRMEWTEKPLYGLHDEPLDYSRCWRR